MEPTNHANLVAMVYKLCESGLTMHKRVIALADGQLLLYEDGLDTLDQSALHTHSLAHLQPKHKVEVRKMCYIFHNMQRPKQVLLRFANKYLTHAHKKVDEEPGYNPEDDSGRPIDWKFEFQSESEAIEWFELLRQIKGKTIHTLTHGQQEICI